MCQSDSVMMDYYVNPHIAATERIFPPQGRNGFLRCDMNENPEGLPREFVDAVMKEVTPEFLSTYPEPGPFMEKYARFLGVGYENLMTTNGSDMAIRYLLETFGEPGKKVVTVSPTFEMYGVNCSLLGLQHVAVPYDDNLQMDTRRILEAIDEDTRIVVLLNPNNPVGNAYTEEEFNAIADEAAKARAIVIVDEAYHYFYKGTFLSNALALRHVAVLRTFSKCFSLAAVRLGVIIAHPELIANVTRARLSFDVNSIALLFAERLMEHPEVLDRLMATQEEGKAWLLGSLRENGYECRDALGNYIFVRPHADALELSQRLKTERRVLVKTFSRGPLRPYLRVSTGSPGAMQRFAEALYLTDMPSRTE